MLFMYVNDLLYKMVRFLLPINMDNYNKNLQSIGLDCILNRDNIDKNYNWSSIEIYSRRKTKPKT